MIAWSTPALADEVVESDDGGAKHPSYVVGGIVSLAAAGGFAVGGGVAVASDSPQTAIGLLGLGTIAAGVGLPLVLLGAQDERAASSVAVATGTAIATPGVIAIGLGGAFWAGRAASGDPDAEDDIALPLVMILGGAAATVGGIILWASGAGPDEEAKAELSVSPTGASLRGTF